MNIQEIINEFSNRKDLMNCETCLIEGFDVCNRHNKAVCLLESFVDILNFIKAEILKEVI